MPKIDTTNKHLVSSQGERIVIMLPPRGPIEKDDALTLAAWIVAIVGDEERFREILSAVEGT
jgi:hypothetical protein